MKAFKITTTFMLCILLLAAGVAAECLALMKCTLLDPGFYGGEARGAYEQIGRTVVRRLSEGVLEKAPAIALRTTNEDLAYEIASGALPPGEVADMLERSGPAVARYLLQGGDMPVLDGAAQFEAGETALMKSLLMDDLLKLLPEKPSFPAFMPFTPEWNAVYGPDLARSIALPRYYLGFTGYALGAALAAIVLFAGLLYLMWLRERKPFFGAAGALFLVNGMLLLAVSAAISYYCRPMAEGAAAMVPLSGAAQLFESDWPVFFRSALWPFREIAFMAAIASLSLAVAAFGAMNVRYAETPAEPIWVRARRHKHAKPAFHDVLKAGTDKSGLNADESKKAEKRRPKHERKN